MAEKLRNPREWGRNSFSASQVSGLIFNMGIWLMAPNIERFPLVFNFFKGMTLQCFVCLYLLLPSIKAMTDVNMKWAVFFCFNDILSLGFFCWSCSLIFCTVVHKQFYSTALVGQDCTIKRHNPRLMTWGPTHHSSMIITHADPVSEVICSYLQSWDTLLMFFIILLSWIWWWYWKIKLSSASVIPYKIPFYIISSVEDMILCFHWDF